MSEHMTSVDHSSACRTGCGIDNTTLAPAPAASPSAARAAAASSPGEPYRSPAASSVSVEART